MRTRVVDVRLHALKFLRMEEYEEAQCEAYLEAGYCACDDDQADEDCQNNCFSAAGMSFCVEEEVQYFLGPHCADQGGEIRMGLFMDDTCTTFADDYGGVPTFAKISNGVSLPYGSSSLIDTTCWSCLAEDDNDDNAAAAEPSEFCAGAYELAGKCEENLGSNSQNENACNWLEGIKITNVNGIIYSGSGSKNKVAGAFIAIFAVSFLLLGSYVYYLKTKLDRSRIHLSD